LRCRNVTRQGRRMVLPPSTALIVIDLQEAIDHPSWGRRNNPQAEENIYRARKVANSMKRRCRKDVFLFSRNPLFVDRPLLWNDLSSDPEDPFYPLFDVLKVLVVGSSPDIPQPAR